MTATNLFTQRLVTQYAKYRALKNLLDKWLDEKREVLFVALLAGAPCPDKGPFLLELCESSQRINWKDEFVSYLRDQGSSEEEVVTIMAAREARHRLNAQKSPRIDVKANPNYRRPFPIKLPA